jgi:hypothetical protein
VDQYFVPRTEKLHDQNATRINGDDRQVKMSNIQEESSSTISNQLNLLNLNVRISLVLPDALTPTSTPCLEIQHHAILNFTLPSINGFK